MDTVILIAGFAGSWLLVAGSLYQAVLELQDENIERGRAEAAFRSITPPPPVSPWWWLLPPIKIYLERMRSRRYRSMYYEVLSPEDTKSLVSFISKATGWLYVGLGGLLIAAKETYELSANFGWNLLLYIATVLGVLLLCVVNTALRMRRGKLIIEQKNEGQNS